MNWHRAGRHLLEVWPLLLVLCLIATALTEGVYRAAKSARRPWRAVWLYLIMSLVVLLLVPGLAMTGGDPSNIVIVLGSIYLVPLTSLYLAVRIGRANWMASPKAAVVPAIAVVASSWLLFTFFYFLVYKAHQ